MFSFAYEGLAPKKGPVLPNFVKITSTLCSKSQRTHVQKENGEHHNQPAVVHRSVIEKLSQTLETYLNQRSTCFRRPALLDRRASFSVPPTPEAFLQNS
jgi:hypothetical protein